MRKVIALVCLFVLIAPEVYAQSPSRSVSRHLIIADELAQMEMQLVSRVVPPTYSTTSTPIVTEPIIVTPTTVGPIVVSTPTSSRTASPTVSFSKASDPVQEPFVIASQTQEVMMDDDLWSEQPKTTLRLLYKTALVLHGENIQRFLVVTPGILNVERVDGDRLQVFAARRGTSILHVWDNRGRWTFNIEITLPQRKSSVEQQQQDQKHVEADPFTFSYNMDWASYNRGDSFDNMERQSLTFFQRYAIEGETPYGQLDASISIDKFNKDSDISQRTIGLTDAKFGPFTDIALRGFDANRSLSHLSIPGKFFRGVSVGTETLNNNVGLSYFRGRDSASFGVRRSGVSDDLDQFIEGAQLKLFPHGKHQLDLNYGRGWGDDRPDFLKDEVYSVVERSDFGPIDVETEVAHDEEHFATTVSASYHGDTQWGNISFRNIEKGFTTLTNRPGDEGEIGVIATYDKRFERSSFHSRFEVYRERLFPNPDDENALNHETQLSFSTQLTDNLNWNSSIFYNDTEGQTSPRRNLRANTRLSRRFKVFRQNYLNLFAGTSYQRSRSDSILSSEYDRYSTNVGMNFSITQGLSYFANYEYSWIDDEVTSDMLNPHVLSTGLNYYRQFNDRWSGNARLEYRNEEDTEGVNSFLAGEDSVTGSLGVTYRPKQDFEVFVDGRARTVWPENARQVAFNDADIRFGVRSDWNLPFAWNPKGIVEGWVFKDLNGNQRKDPGESGIAGLNVYVGQHTVKTNRQGYYMTPIRAKKVLVVLDQQNLPKGAVLTTKPEHPIEISNGDRHVIDFGLSTQSKISGRVYVDRNNNSMPDAGDEFVRRARVKLDGNRRATTGNDGRYTFNNISAGQHQVQLDLSSLPIEYLPKVKLKSSVHVEEGESVHFDIPLTVK